MSAEAIKEKEPQYSKTRVRLILAALVFFMIVYGFGIFKLIPMQDAIMNYFHISEGSYGYLSTAQNWIVIFAAVPMGFLIRRFPCRWTFPLGFLVAAIGVSVQITTQSYVIFVAGRMIEGAGTGLIMLAGYSLILNLVPDNRKGLWSSVLVVSAVLPQIAITKGGTALMSATGMTFQMVFGILGAMYIVASIIWVLIVPSSLKAHGVASSQKATREQTLRVYKNPSVWLTSVALIFFTLVSNVFSVYVVRFLMLKGMDRPVAASTYSWMTILGTASMLVIGFLADKLGTKRKIAIVGFLVCSLAMFLLAKLPVNLVFIYVILFGTFPRGTVGLTNAAASDLAEVPSDVPIVTSLKNTILQIGNVLGGIALGYLIQFKGYEFTSCMLGIGCIIGAVCWFFAKKVK